MKMGLFFLYEIHKRQLQLSAFLAEIDILFEFSIFLMSKPDGERRPQILELVDTREK